MGSFSPLSWAARRGLKLNFSKGIMEGALEYPHFKFQVSNWIQIKIGRFLFNLFGIRLSGMNAFLKWPVQGLYVCILFNFSNQTVCTEHLPEVYFNATAEPWPPLSNRIRLLPGGTLSEVLHEDQLQLLGKYGCATSIAMRTVNGPWIGGKTFPKLRTMRDGCRRTAQIYETKLFSQLTPINTRMAPKNH